MSNEETPHESEHDSTVSIDRRSFIRTGIVGAAGIATAGAGMNAASVQTMPPEHNEDIHLS